MLQRVPSANAACVSLPLSCYCARNLVLRKEAFILLEGEPSTPAAGYNFFFLAKTKILETCQSNFRILGGYSALRLGNF